MTCIIELEKHYGREYKEQELATGAELTLEEKINKIKSREITEAEKNMLTLPAFEAACEAVKKVTYCTGNRSDLQQIFQ